jgi:hypothetical protein
VALRTTYTERIARQRERWAMNDRDRGKLPHGLCAECLLRGNLVNTGRTDGRIPWPRCRAIGARGGSGLLLAGELVAAVRRESAAAVAYWWGVS